MIFSMLSTPLLKMMLIFALISGLSHSSDKLVNINQYVASAGSDVNLVFVVSSNYLVLNTHENTHACCLRENLCVFRLVQWPMGKLIKITQMILYQVNLSWIAFLFHHCVFVKILNIHVPLQVHVMSFLRVFQHHFNAFEIASSPLFQPLKTHHINQCDMSMIKIGVKSNITQQTIYYI